MQTDWIKNWVWTEHNFEEIFEKFEEEQKKF